MPHKTKELRKEYRQKNRERILERQVLEHSRIQEPSMKGERNEL